MQRCITISILNNSVERYNLWYILAYETNWDNCLHYVYLHSEGYSTRSVCVYVRLSVLPPQATRAILMASALRKHILALFLLYILHAMLMCVCTSLRNNYTGVCYCVRKLHRHREPRFQHWCFHYFCIKMFSNTLSYHRLIAQVTHWYNSTFINT